MNTPWSNISRKLTDEEWAQLCAWRKANPRSLRAATVRGDGRVFLNFGRSYAGGEYWATPSQAAKAKERDAAHKRKAEVKKRENRRRKEKYHTDAAYRARVIDRASAYGKKVRENGSRYLYMRERYRKSEAARAAHRIACDKWIAKNRDKFRDYVNVRRKRIGAALHPECDRAVLGALFRFCRALSSHTGIKHEVDHIIPVKHGGFHHHLNMGALPVSLNRSKGDNPFWTSDKYLDWRSVPARLWPETLRAKYSELLSNHQLAA